MSGPRFSFTGFLGAVAVVVVAPMVVSAVARRSPALASMRPRIPLSMVRPNAAVPDGSLLMQDEAARRKVVIEQLPIPYVSVKLENVNTEETATFELTTDGRPRPEHVARVESFFGCRRTGRHRPISPGVLAVLLHVQKRWPNRVIEVVSGFRAPPYGAPHSKHFRGLAIDLRVKGVRTSQVRDFVWREHRGVGVGHYRGDDFVHIDWRPGEPDAAWSARGEDGTPDYRPRWARKVRHTKRPVRANVAGALTVANATARSL
jgi:uncharacterized protein YcbK (DUF882 family)